MHNAVIFQIFDEFLFHPVVVVSVIQRAGTGKEVDIAVPAFIK